MLNEIINIYIRYATKQIKFEYQVQIRMLITVLVMLSFSRSKYSVVDFTTGRNQYLASSEKL